MSYRLPVEYKRIRPALLLLLLAGILALAAVLPLRESAQSALAPTLFGVAITIDAGHGGSDPGAVGENSVEKEINLAVALHLAELCRAAGAEVTLTRETDTALAERKRDDLQQRVQLTRDSGAAVFVSLHCNNFVSDPTQHGAQVFYQAGNAAGEKLAEQVQQALAAETGDNKRSALAHPDAYLLKNLDCAAVICEMGFLSNAQEEALLLDEEYQWRLAWAVFNGLAEYLSLSE